MALQLVCIDAADTLWHNETFFWVSHERFAALLRSHAEADVIERFLDATKLRNLSTYGYGVKGFTLSMIETALELSGERLPVGVVAEIVRLGREMMRHPVELLDGVQPTLEALASRARMVVVTKGDLFHQESELVASGLDPLFSGVEIVSEKTADTYARVFARYGVAPQNALMAGNSMKSDVLPALGAGAYASLVPYPIVWARTRLQTSLLVMTAIAGSLVFAIWCHGSMSSRHEPRSRYHLRHPRAFAARGTPAPRGGQRDHPCRRHR